MCTRMYLYKNAIRFFLHVLVVNHVARLSLTETANVFVNLFKESPIMSHRFRLLKMYFCVYFWKLLFFSTVALIITRRHSINASKAINWLMCRKAFFLTRHFEPQNNNSAMTAVTWWPCKYIVLVWGFGFLFLVSGFGFQVYIYKTNY